MRNQENQPHIWHLKHQPWTSVLFYLQVPGRLKSNALLNSSPLEYIEITHPYHPFLGQRFPVLKKRRVSGNDTLILKGSSLGTFAVLEEWTDRKSPPNIKPCRDLPFFDFQCLLELGKIVNETVKRRKKKC